MRARLALFAAAAMLSVPARAQSSEVAQLRAELARARAEIEA